MNRGSHLMCKKWYQLITCTEPVGALNRRSFFIPKRPAPNHGCGSFFTACLDNSAGFCRCLDVFCRSLVRNGVKSMFFLQVFCRLQVRNASD